LGTQHLEGYVQEVESGDTVIVHTCPYPDLPDMRVSVRVRALGFDAPDERADNKGIAELGRRSRVFATQLLLGQTVTLYCTGKDAFGVERAEIILADGVKLRDIIVQNYLGLSREGASTQDQMQVAAAFFGKECAHAQNFLQTVSRPVEDVTSIAADAKVEGVTTPVAAADATESVATPVAANASAMTPVAVNPMRPLE
jgi:hypothetical protein